MPAPATQRGRCVVWLPPHGLDPRRLPPAMPAGQSALLTGGERSMHELAVALAAGGHSVEVRGRVEVGELRRLGAAAGATPELPVAPRDIEAGDVLLVLEGNVDLRLWARLAVSPARAVCVALAPLGLFGWPFAEPWSMPSPHTVALDSLARPEHFQSMHALGIELWTPMPHLVEQSHAAGVPCAFIGNGRPLPFPEPAPKRFDVATIPHNRWAQAGQAVLERLDPAVSRVVVEGTNDRVLEQLGEARILIHPSRIEGHSRLSCEARAMGAVPVVLDSNSYGVGLDEAGGALALGSVEEMPAAITALLADEPRLAALRERGMRSARQQVDWPAYVQRVDAALHDAPQDVARPARAALGRALDRRAAALEAHVESLVRRLAATVAAPVGDPAEPRWPGRAWGHVDAAAVEDGMLRVEGWVAFAAAPLARVEVWLGDVALGDAVTGVERPDVRDAIGVRWAETGGFWFAAGHGDVPAGAAELRVRATAIDGETFDLGPTVIDLQPATRPA